MRTRPTGYSLLRVSSVICLISSVYWNWRNSKKLTKYVRVFTQILAGTRTQMWVRFLGPSAIGMKTRGISAWKCRIIVAKINCKILRVAAVINFRTLTDILFLYITKLYYFVPRWARIYHTRHKYLLQGEENLLTRSHTVYRYPYLMILL